MNIEDYYNLNNVYNNAIKYLGKNVDIKLSTRKNKKFMILNPNNNKWIHFGLLGYKYFTLTGDKNKQYRYFKRAMNIKGNWINDKYSPNNLAINILWK